MPTPTPSCWPGISPAQRPAGSSPGATVSAFAGSSADQVEHPLFDIADDRILGAVGIDHGIGFRPLPRRSQIGVADAFVKREIQRLEPALVERGGGVALAAAVE